ncbi:Serine hydrolase-like protein [Manis javanica]|nr:Serine hydrolase-like protein [Manis javanica]
MRFHESSYAELRILPGSCRACLSPWSRTASPAAQDNASHRMAYWEWNRTGDPNHPHVVVCVHGLSRQGRDFDVLAERLSERARVICPDVVGRGESDWLQDPAAYQVPLYAADMLALLASVHAQAPVEQLDWVGTSMGGLIGMALAGQPACYCRCPSAGWCSTMGGLSSSGLPWSA